MFKKYVTMLIIYLNISYADNIYISTEINSSKVLLSNVEFTTCDIIIGDSLININDKYTRIAYISQEKISQIPIIDDTKKIFINTDKNTSNIAGYLLLVTSDDFFNREIIFPKKNSCYKKIFRDKEKYFYSRNMEILWGDKSVTRVISKIYNKYGTTIDEKFKRIPLLYMILLRDVNNEPSFYPFFTLNSINKKLWKMHKAQKYDKFYEVLLKKFEQKAQNLNYIDTIAWVYADNKNIEQALKIYKNKILPFLKKDDKDSSKFIKSYKELKEKAK